MHLFSVLLRFSQVGVHLCQQCCGDCASVFAHRMCQGVGVSECRSRSVGRYEQFGQQPSVLPDVQQLYDAPIVGRDI